jgi:putative peptidoglycan lipid II flippase
MLKNLFNKQTNNITLAAFMVAISSLLSRLLGVFRDRILAGEFGAGNTLDIYYSAFRIPDLIFNLIILGALSAGFIPVFTGLIKDFKSYNSFGLFKFLNKEAWDLVNNVLNVILISLVILSALGIIFAPGIIRLISPGFSVESQQLTVVLSRIMFLSPIFLGISGILGGVLQSFKNFFVYSLAPILYNIGIIVGALYFVPLWGVKGLAWGVVLGAAMHMIIQLPAVFNLGFRYQAFINFKDASFRKIIRMMGPRTLSLAISQINLVVITVIASGLASGSLAVFNFANNLQSFPIGIFGISFAVAAFPILSANAGDSRKLITNFSSTTRQILFFIIPATVLIITLRAQIIRVVLGTGSFDWQDTVLTMETLAFFGLSLFAQALIPLQTRVFYARHDSRTPFFIGLIVVITNVFLSLYFGKKMGVSGLALAFSLSSILNFVLLWIWLWAKIGDMDQIKILISTVKFSVAAIVGGLVVQVTKTVVWPYINMEKFSGVFIQGLAAATFGFLAYLLICWILRSEELASFMDVVRRRLSWHKVKVGDQTEVRGI